jgi:DNA-binding Xre family transcriptional regulator
MIKIKIADIAKKNGFNNAYGLQNALKCSPTMASRLWKGEFEQIGIETIDRLCELFKCSPSDLLVFQSKNPVVKVEPEKPAREPRAVEKQATGEYHLTVEDAAKFLNLSKRQVRFYAKEKQLKGTQGKQNYWFFRQEDLQEFADSRSNVR